MDSLNQLAIEFGLRTLLTFFAQRSRFVVVQNHGQIQIQQATPVETPVRHRFGTVGFTDRHAPASHDVMPAANLFDLAPVRCILLWRHRRKERIRFLDLPLMYLPRNHEFHDGSFR